MKKYNIVGLSSFLALLKAKSHSSAWAIILMAKNITRQEIALANVFKIRDIITEAVEPINFFIKISLYDVCTVSFQSLKNSCKNFSFILRLILTFQGHLSFPQMLKKC
ncbi:MAG TPA: hypothetical protein PLN83_03675, partial [Syntrophorhabdus sp.]|nr:hypothetical protein [Syntrophorhabdus sp.]